MNETTFFNNQLACEVGVNEAIILGRIWFFVDHNRLTEKNFYDGKFWMYDSAKAFIKKFSFFNEKQFYRIIEKLENDGWIVTGNYNKRSNDRTKWYSLGQKMIEFLQKDNTESLENERNSHPRKRERKEDSTPENGSSSPENGCRTPENGRALPVQTHNSPIKDTHQGGCAREGKIPPLPDDGKRSEKFEKFWNEYPPRLGRKEKEYPAWQEWQRQRIDQLAHIFVKIMESLKKFKQTKDWKEQNGRFIPFAHNWLRERRYEEMPEDETQKETPAQRHQNRHILSTVENL